MTCDGKNLPNTNDGTVKTIVSSISIVCYLILNNQIEFVIRIN